MNHRRDSGLITFKHKQYLCPQNSISWREISKTLQTQVLCNLRVTASLNSPLFLIQPILEAVERAHTQRYFE